MDQLQQAVIDKASHAGLAWQRTLGRKVMIGFYGSCGNLECSPSTHGIFTKGLLNERKWKKRGGSLCKCVYFVLHTVIRALRRVVQLLFVAMDTQTQGPWAPTLKAALYHREVLETSKTDYKMNERGNGLSAQHNIICKLLSVYDCECVAQCLCICPSALLLALLCFRKLAQRVLESCRTQQVGMSVSAGHKRLDIKLAGQRKKKFITQMYSGPEVQNTKPKTQWQITNHSNISDDPC